MDKISKLSIILISILSVSVLLLSSIKDNNSQEDYLRYTIDYEYIAVPVQSQNQQPCAYEIWKVPIGNDNKIQEEFILRVDNCEYSTSSN